ncbi:MAG: F0F1 ATP synthase subunit gamma, partial [Gammaproteobacteria bacterium RIFOXYB2_FULL_38_6]
MAQTREIRTKIASVKSTQKITKAMQLVAASKMRRTQTMMERTRPYSHKIRSVLEHVAMSSAEYNHPYVHGHPSAKKIGFIVVSSDRGLCGGLNTNLFRALIQKIQAFDSKGLASELCLIGRKGEVFFEHHGGNIQGTAEYVGEHPLVKDLVGIVKVMLDAFDEKKYHSLYMVYNEFVNTMKQQPTIHQLLPLPLEKTAAPKHWDYIYEPDDAKLILNQLMRRYIESQVYQAVVENVACFQAAQMVAMKSAT